MPKVSIITPVYGVERYIAQCVDSLAAQTLDDMEFLLVDDHSPDNSMALARQEAEKTGRLNQFRFLQTPQNMGAGGARNYAMDFASGEYVGFVDSDDWVEPSTFESLYNHAKELDSDLCCCQIQKDYENGDKPSFLSNPTINEGPISPENRAFALSHYISLFTSFIYRRSFLLQSGVRFYDGRYAEDSFFVSCAWLMAQSIAYVNQPLYHYIIHSGSACTSAGGGKYAKRLAVFSQVLDFAKNKGVYEQFKPEIDFLFLKKGYLSALLNASEESPEKRALAITETQKHCTDLLGDYRSNKYFHSKKALLLLDALVRHCPRTAGWLLHLSGSTF